MPPANAGVVQPDSSQDQYAPTSGESVTAELIAEAAQQVRNGNLGGARETLDKVKAKNPNQPYLWSMYGTLDEMMDRNYELAAQDFRKELEAHPDNKMAVVALADAETKTHDPGSARKTLHQYLERHPDDAQLAIFSLPP